ncbi:CoA-binding protein [Rhodobacter sp. TJ_12]|uniref:CoA-binding protein n=1 Tax=Rhodobacter sp. TJ_12 TaxID=2029399 RepID=UPI001CBBB13E|nr:CoA-binding protein [Rhodobacter sp. TJ_12]MBZ4022628.1 CoA-binding protein [Rhodobacter sp. TJ_12]
MTDAELREIFSQTKVIAVVGFSANPTRPAHEVAAWLQGRGYRVIPVNPGLAGQTYLGEVVYADLAAIPREIAVDMVDIFRTPAAVPGIVEQVLTARAEVKTLWMQLGVVHEPAAQDARAAGKRVVMDRCPKIEMPRLGI